MSAVNSDDFELPTDVPDDTAFHQHFGGGLAIANADIQWHQAQAKHKARQDLKTEELREKIEKLSKLTWQDAKEECKLEAFNKLFSGTQKHILGAQPSKRYFALTAEVTERVVTATSAIRARLRELLSIEKDYINEKSLREAREFELALNKAKEDLQITQEELIEAKVLELAVAAKSPVFKEKDRIIAELDSLIDAKTGVIGANRKKLREWELQLKGKEQEIEVFKNQIMAKDNQISTLERRLADLGFSKIVDHDKWRAVVELQQQMMHKLSSDLLTAKKASQVVENAYLAMTGKESREMVEVDHEQVAREVDLAIISKVEGERGNNM